ncbi:MAG: GspE/PulE family protein [Alphaproteobacteria bacterium]
MTADKSGDADKSLRDDVDVESAEGAAKPAKPMRIGEKLLSLGLISPDQLQIVLTEQKTTKKLFGAILVEMGFITESALGEVLAESSGTQKFDPKSAMLDSAVVRRVPKEIAVRHKVLPVSYEHDTFKLAMADVYNVLAIDQVRRHVPRNAKIIPIYCTESEILELIDQYYDYEISIDGILKEIETGIREHTKLDGRQEGYVNPTVRLVNALLVDAIKQGASDIHFEPEGSFLRLRYRIDGNMVQVRSLHLDYWAAMAVRIKIMSGMNIAEARNPQDGRISYTVLGREIDFRVATQPTIHGENIVMRLLDKAKSLVPLEDLGFSDYNTAILKRMIKRPEGIIIVTGPTGSGKTTTLYSVLNYINSIDTNIMTLEDPVEYQLPLIRQSNVREGTGMDFTNGIKSMMRQDPDIIFIGEVRDEDTALMAVRAALTGHQVYTTLHTNDALGAIPRLNDIGIPSHLLAGSLIGCLAQRLARKLCTHCRKARSATAEECKILGVDAAKPPTIYEAVGCERCNRKGYKGRTAIVEVLRIDRAFDELIATNATRKVMADYALQNGFVTMQQDGINKVIAGEIALDELINTIDLTDRL